MNDLDEKNKGFNKEAQWYLALAYIKIDDRENAITALNGIVNDPSANYWRDVANEILVYLD